MNRKVQQPLLFLAAGAFPRAFSSFAPTTQFRALAPAASGPIVRRYRHHPPVRAHLQDRATRYGGRDGDRSPRRGAYERAGGVEDRDGRFKAGRGRGNGRSEQDFASDVGEREGRFKAGRGRGYGRNDAKSGVDRRDAFRAGRFQADRAEFDARDAFRSGRFRDERASREGDGDRRDGRLNARRDADAASGREQNRMDDAFEYADYSPEDVGRSSSAPPWSRSSREALTRERRGEGRPEGRPRFDERGGGGRAQHGDRASGRMHSDERGRGRYGREQRYPRSRFDDRQGRIPDRARSDEPRDGPRDGRDENQEPTAIQQALASDDDLLYGLQPVRLALTAGRRDAKTLYLQPDGGKTGTSRKPANARVRSAIVAEAEARGIRVSSRDRGELNALCGNRPHQGVVLQCCRLEYSPLARLEKGKAGDVWIALDEVSDPQNLGALLRTAHFLGAKGVAVCRKNSAKLSPAVSKASAGAAEVMRVEGVESMPRFLRDAGERGWRVLGAAGEKGAVPLREVEVGPPTVLVLGSEGDGLRSMVRQCCGSLVTIRQGDECVEEVDSLNVSVAGALAMFHLIR